jgi:hypothetical protein
MRARDALDRAHAEPLDVRAVAAVAHLSGAHSSRSFRADRPAEITEKER